MYFEMLFFIIEISPFIKKKKILVWDEKTY